MRTQTAFERFSGSNAHIVFPVALVVMRFVVGVEFLSAGLSKMSGWSASSFLEQATGPLAVWFQSMAGSPVVDFLNIWGLTLIGLSLFLGLLVRPAAIAGAIMMMLYYLAGWETNIAHGYIDQHIILMTALFLFATGGAGHILGLNGFAQEYFRKKNALLRWLLG